MEIVQSSPIDLYNSVYCFLPKSCRCSGQPIHNTGEVLGRACTCLPRSVALVCMPPPHQVTVPMVLPSPPTHTSPEALEVGMCILGTVGCKASTSHLLTHWWFKTQKWWKGKEKILPASLPWTTCFLFLRDLPLAACLGPSLGHLTLYQATPSTSSKIMKHGNYMLFPSSANFHKYPCPHNSTTSSYLAFCTSQYILENITQWFLERLCGVW